MLLEPQRDYSDDLGFAISIDSDPSESSLSASSLSA